MKISAKYEFAFLCNPKCGSTSIEKAIKRYCESGLGGTPSLKHISARMFKRHIRPLLRRAGLSDKIETFCIIREPIERVYSWYRYQSRPLLSNKSHKNHAKYTGGMSFETFVEGYMAENKPPYAKISNQADFINLPNGELGVDHIFRLDRLDTVEEFLSRKIGKPIEIPHHNVSPKSVSNAGKSSKRNAQVSVVGPDATISEKPSSPEPMHLSDDLLARLKKHLAIDYQIYNSLSGL